MKKLLLPIFSILMTSLIFSGCSNKYPVTFNSNPKGASVVCNGKNWGYTPKTLYYNEKVKQMSSLDFSSCSAHWVSGYSKNYGIIPISNFPDGVEITLERPFDNEYEKDANFALNLQNMEYRRRQAKAAEDAAYQQKRQADQQFYDSNKPKSYNITPNYMGGYNIMQY